MASSAAIVMCGRRRARTGTVQNRLFSQADWELAKDGITQLGIGADSNDGNEVPNK
jgi:hypothetical protein